MPSPFPGMDPYLEDPAYWGGVHHALVYLIPEALNTSLPSGYKAYINERLYLVEPERNIYPDVFVTAAPVVQPRRKRRKKAAGAVAIDPPRLVVARPELVRERFVEVRRNGGINLVTTLEILSPVNKRKGHPGRQLYRSKQRELLLSQTSLVEIDLLRRGLHTVAVPRGALHPPTPTRYLVCLHRGGDGKRYEVWEFTLRQRLPRIAVPLAGDDPDVGLDLQPLLNRCYDVNYADIIDYQKDPVYPLKEDDAAWADALLRERGLRR